MEKYSGNINSATSNMACKYCQCINSTWRSIKHPCLSDLGSLKSVLRGTHNLPTSSQYITRRDYDPKQAALYLQYQNHYFQQTFAADSKTLLRPDELLGKPNFWGPPVRNPMSIIC